MSVGVNVTLSVLVPDGKTAPVAGVYTNVPAIEEDAFNWAEPNGVPDRMAPGAGQVIVGISSVLTVSVTDAVTVL
jgi:hypothetical protein